MQPHESAGSKVLNSKEDMEGYKLDFDFHQISRVIHTVSKLGLRV